MKVKTKPELMLSMKHYQKLAAERWQVIDCQHDRIKQLEKEAINLQAEVFMSEMPINPWQSQHGGTHYAELTIQPLQYTLGSLGYEAFKGACHNHVARYTTRKKDNEVTQLKKARHILDLWIYEAEKNNK